MKIIGWGLVVPGLVWAVVRVSGWTPGPAVIVLPFTPYALVWTLVPLGLALGFKQWRAAAVAGLTTLVLLGCVGPRMVADRDRGPRDGIALTVLTANMLTGLGDPDTIVRKVRSEDVGVLALQEFTAAGQAALKSAGLEELLPYSSIAGQRPRDPYGTTGSAVYSRYPLSDKGFRLNNGGFQQAYGTIQVPGARPVVVESAHPASPYSLSVLGIWRRDQAEQPAPDPDGPARILLGDFNSTLDHAQLRTLIGRGYRDAAATLGRGLVPSWGWYGNRRLPPITIDHVLVDRRLGISDYAAYDLPGSDHRMVLATVTLPGGD
ncbi:endonuclease/exonuclease/phosphatase family protein [Actinoplanes sp. NPDC049596]|uniref:endonuclease/exonuclease/phosphatase family protein n=1 Tax=unclassified Actinoplanes TaxID=2626549 RepID=UPI003413063E